MPKVKVLCACGRAFSRCYKCNVPLREKILAYQSQPEVKARHRAQVAAHSAKPEVKAARKARAHVRYEEKKIRAIPAQNLQNDQDQIQILHDNMMNDILIVV